MLKSLSSVAFNVKNIGGYSGLLNKSSSLNAFTKTTTSICISNNSSRLQFRFYSSKQQPLPNVTDKIETPNLLTVSSYFKFPEYGVHDYVNLSRGTAFLVKTPKQMFVKQERPVYAISCAHITHPFNFPHLYKEESHQWIFALGEQNIKVQLEYRDGKTGKVLQSVPINTPFHLHPMLDLVCFEINLPDFQKSDVPYTPSILELQVYEEPRKGHTGKLFGYQLINEKEDIMKPIITDYLYHTGEGRRHYVQTKTPSPMGICGGPVINFDNEVVGMIEGLTKFDVKEIDKYDDNDRRKFYHSMNNNTVYIPSQTINSFLEEVDLHINEK